MHQHEMQGRIRRVDVIERQFVAVGR